ncbi:hypothetical protein JTE90_015769 [Oedothorax gibbosus]|uniref:RBR-type E3 ubiquitin transferase n=1 Tax=Oedothorax gibbosus TaxID=931172 RepID=A0AAV6VVU3_9ARAC|nr:hypothetical protein JTE90_015769 [Oedothorax gibbosus]
MGSSSSKFRRYLQNGDEYAALETFQNSVELQKSLEPNSSYGDSLKHNTPLHLVSQHAMKPLLRIFLTELKGNPNKKNAKGETALHLVCQGDLTRNIVNQERRSCCVYQILQWRGSSKEGEIKVELDAVDDEGNTALHYAASSGLKKCVEILVSHGASMFVENKFSETACDLAEKNKHEDIALFFEAKMLFYSDTSEVVEATASLDEEVVSGLRAQDLQEAKDQLLVETSDMFHVPLFTAEVLLRNYEWSRQALLDAWMRDPVACCKEAGITPPSSALNFSPTQDALKSCCEQIQNEYQSETLNSPSKTPVVKEELTCNICTLNISADESIPVPCYHQFCKECWKTYLTAKIYEGEAHHILCPAYECAYVVPVDVIEMLVSADTVKKYLQFDIKAFVESNPTMKWCPYPSCARAVKIPDMEKSLNEVMTISFSSVPSVSHSVDCGNGHYFCWECSGEAHAPCNCDKWQEWQKKIAEIKPQELKNTYSETEEAENSLWMVSNSKPCPNCKCPIQRNEGCNHMKCTKCKYEYCWVCLESWKKHSPTTGGYFRCFRHEAVKRAEVKTEALINEAEEHNRHMQELKRFLQYYTRFKNHENSHQFEEPFLKSMQDKIAILAPSIVSASSEQIDTSFLEEAVYELLRARRILCGSYVYGFNLEDNGYNKTIFEFLQSELEETTQKLSDVIARTYLQTPHSKIAQMTSNVKRKRHDLLNTVQKGLIPPETPPSQRKKRRHRLPGLMGLDPTEDPLLSQAILDSLENIDPNDPWVINQHGKHTNVAAVCDWPDYDSDDEAGNPILSSVLGECSRDGCKRPRAKFQRTGVIQEFCSLYCKHWDTLNPPELVAPASIDPAIESLIALELSKLQMPRGQLNDFNAEDRNSPQSSTATDVKSLNIVPQETTEEPEALNNLDDASAESTNIDDTLTKNITCSEGDELISESQEETKTEEKVPENCPKSLQQTTINFYLKNTEGYCKNVNVENCFSKTDKELFKALQAAEAEENSRKTVESFIATEEGVSADF